METLEITKEQKHFIEELAKHYNLSIVEIINRILDNTENMSDKELLETVLEYKKSHPSDDNKLYTYDEFIALVYKK